jgi:uncharacterized membrane protein HdeD (DUF308 family)
VAFAIFGVVLSIGGVLLLANVFGHRDAAGIVIGALSVIGGGAAVWMGRIGWKSVEAQVSRDGSDSSLTSR